MKQGCHFDPQSFIQSGLSLELFGEGVLGSCWSGQMGSFCVKVRELVRPGSTQKGILERKTVQGPRQPQPPASVRPRSRARCISHLDGDQLRPTSPPDPSWGPCHLHVPSLTCGFCSRVPACGPLCQAPTHSLRCRPHHTRLLPQTS